LHSIACYERVLADLRHIHRVEHKGRLDRRSAGKHLQNYVDVTCDN